MYSFWNFWNTGDIFYLKCYEIFLINYGNTFEIIFLAFFVCILINDTFGYYI